MDICRRTWLSISSMGNTLLEHDTVATGIVPCPDQPQLVGLGEGDDGGRLLQILIGSASGQYQKAWTPKVQVHIKGRTFYSMYSPYCGGLTVATSLIAKWIAGMSISAFLLGVLGSIPSEFSFS